MRGPLRWYGGKGQMLGTLLPLLPAHHTYVEPFAGGAAVFFAKAPAPVEVLNDLDSGLVNFYRVLRDPTTFAAFQRSVSLTPYSREEWRSARETWKSIADPVERAARWFVWIRQNQGAGHIGGGWQLVVTESTGGIAGCVHNWLMAVDRLPETHARLRQAQIEHGVWERMFDLYDTPATLFYVDPPYVHDTRGRHRYACDEMTAQDHHALVERLLTVRGLVVLSGYAHAVYAPLEAAGWERRDIATAAHTVQTRGTGAGTAQAGRVETIWRNPACQLDMGPLFAVGLP